MERELMAGLQNLPDWQKIASEVFERDQCIVNKPRLLEEQVAADLLFGPHPLELCPDTPVRRQFPGRS